MKLSQIVALLVTALAVRSAPLLHSQQGSAGGFAGSASAVQDNDYSNVEPGNAVNNGGGQSASLQGIAGSLSQI